VTGDTYLEHKNLLLQPLFLLSRSLGVLQPLRLTLALEAFRQFERMVQFLAELLELLLDCLFY